MYNVPILPKGTYLIFKLFTNERLYTAGNGVSIIREIINMLIFCNVSIVIPFPDT